MGIRRKQVIDITDTTAKVIWETEIQQLELI